MATLGATLSTATFPDSIPYSGKIVGAFGNGDPNYLMAQICNMGGVPSNPSPTSIGTTTARISYFMLPFALTVNTIRFWGIGVTTNIHTCALYRYSDLARLTASLTFSTAANAWGVAGSSLNVTLAANTLYFIAVGANATNGTVSIAAMNPGPVTNNPWRQALPSAWPGNLAAGAGFIGTALGEFAVTAGAMPDPANTLAVQGTGTNGMPAFFLDNA